MKPLQSVPLPNEAHDSEPMCRDCRTLKRQVGQLRRQLRIVCANYLRSHRHANEQTELFLTAIHREAHHYDVRASYTDRPTRERLANGSPARAISSAGRKL